jgi:hypothetical protein
VKIGEHLLALSTDENIFFRGEDPGKDLHFFTAGGFWRDCSDKLSKTTQKIADRHGKVKQSEHLFL